MSLLKNLKCENCEFGRVNEDCAFDTVFCTLRGPFGKPQLVYKKSICKEHSARLVPRLLIYCACWATAIVFFVAGAGVSSCSRKLDCSTQRIEEEDQK